MPPLEFEFVREAGRGETGIVHKDVDRAMLLVDLREKGLDLIFIGAMGPPGAGKNTITARYTWHYNVLTITPYEGEGLNRIFETIMKWFLGKFNSAVAGQTKNLVAACLDVYRAAGEHLLPTPSKSHYLFNLRDLGKVFQGICLCTK